MMFRSCPHHWHSAAEDAQRSRSSLHGAGSASVSSKVHTQTSRNFPWLENLLFLTIVRVCVLHVAGRTWLELQQALEISTDTPGQQSDPNHHNTHWWADRIHFHVIHSFLYTHTVETGETILYVNKCACVYATCVCVHFLKNNLFINC